MTNASFIDSLPSQERDTLMTLLKLHDHDPGEIVISQEENSKDVYFVIGGSARATIFSDEGKIVAYRDILAGAIFGELSAIDDAPRSASVVAVKKLRVGRLPQSSFRELIENSPKFTRVLLEYMTAQLRGMTARIFEFSTMLVRERLLAELLRMGEAATGEIDPGASATSGGTIARINPPPTHFDLATRISTHREAVSREMSKLTKQNLISKGDDGSLAIDMDGLRALREAGLK